MVAPHITAKPRDSNQAITYSTNSRHTPCIIMTTADSMMATIKILVTAYRILSDVRILISPCEVLEHSGNALAEVIPFLQRLQRLAFFRR